MKIGVGLVSALCVAAPAPLFSQAEPWPAPELLTRSIAYHDPGGKWQQGAFRITDVSMGGARALTERFMALSSHYLFEPCFTRVGEGHDKGGVESRGKGLRLQHLTPIPEGESPRAISEELLDQVNRAAEHKLDVQGKSVVERFAEELPLMLALPPVPFEARKAVAVSVSSKALVSLEGASYSVPSHWARLEAMAHVGVEDVQLLCRSETLYCPREPRGGRRVRYRHYLSELSRKPQAVRQVADELVVELGEPYTELWRPMVASHGQREAARVLGAVVDHGEQCVAEALREALGGGRPNLLALGPLLSGRRLQSVPVPESLALYEVESARGRSPARRSFR